MKSCRIIAFAAALSAIVSCAGEQARIKGSVEGAAGKQLLVRQLNLNTYKTLDTLVIGSGGDFSYTVKVLEGQPEFVYLFIGDTQIAALLLEKGETAVVSADTLGHYEVSGSEGSARLKDVNTRYSAFLNAVIEADGDPGKLSRLYVDYYRECVRYVMGNTKSLVSIPVLFQTLGAMSVFSRPTDAIFFRNVADSLKTVYPESRYVKALDKEAQRRVQTMALDTRLRNAESINFPDIVLPDMKGEARSLAEVGSRVILVHFWDASDAAQKMLNVDTLLPVYEDYHDKGFEIYSICLTPDKALWGSVVLSQKLPWINVNDGNGPACPAVVSYNISSLPTSFMIVDGEIRPDLSAKGESGLRNIISSQLK